MMHNRNADPHAAGLAAEDATLRTSITALSRLTTARLGLEDVLTEIANFAVQAIPNAKGAGLTLVQPQQGDTVVATADFVREIEDIQYGMGEGPCIIAMREGRTVLSTSLGGDLRWPRFAGRVARLGVHSTIGLPLETSEGIIGAINVYSHPKDAFTPRAAELGRLFAVPAAIAVENAQVLDQTRRLACQLERAMGTSGSINRAVGIIMSRTGATPEDALARLRQLSHREHRKVSKVAESIVDQAASKARARDHA